MARGDVHRLGGRVEGPPERYLQKDTRRRDREKESLWVNLVWLGVVD